MKDLLIRVSEHNLSPATPSGDRYIKVNRSDVFFLTDEQEEGKASIQQLSEPEDVILEGIENEEIETVTSIQGRDNLTRDIKSLMESGYLENNERILETN